MDVPPPAAIEPDEPESIDLGIVLGDTDDVPPPPPLPADIPPRQGLAAPAHVVRFAPSIPGGLPWYYKFLSGIAMLGVIGGVLCWAVGFFFVFGTISEPSSGGSGAKFVLFFYMIGAGISLMIVPSLILLALDIGKSLRELIGRQGG